MTKLLRFGCALVSGWLGLATAPAATLTLSDAGGGAVSPPVAHGDYLYVGTGATLSVWNLSDPTQPAYSGRTSDAPAPGPIRGLAIVGDYLYAVWNTPSDTGGVTIYALTDPTHPVAVGEFDDYIASDFKRPSAIAANGDVVYIGDEDNGLVVLDASDPLNPAAGATVDGIYEFDTMTLIGDRLLSSGTSFIGGRIVDVIDVSDAANPALAGQAVIDDPSVLRAVPTDGYAIAVGFDLVVYDIRDPSNIQQIYSGSIDEATDAIFNGSTLYLIGASGIQVWDFTTPSAPSLLRTVAMDAFLPDQAVDTSFGPVILTHTDRGLVLGVGDPLNSVLAGEFALPIGVAAHASAFDATHAYFAEEGYGLAAADATTLAPVGRYDADLPFDPAQRDMEDISVDAHRAYLAAWGYGILAVDLSDPAHPAELGRLSFPYVDTVEAHGDRVYAGSGTNGGFFNFKIIDVSDPAHPAELGSLTTSETMDLTVRGNYAFLADEASFGDGGLRVVDVSDPSLPNVVGQDTDCSYADGVDVSADGNTVYIACAADTNFENALEIIDTTDKAHPVLIGSVSLPGSDTLPDYNAAHAVVVAGDVAFVGHEYGVDEVDISDPANPVVTTRHETGYTVRALARAPDGRVFAFAGEAGTFVFQADRVFANGFE